MVDGLIAIDYFLDLPGRKWQATPVFLPGKSHGQRSLVGYSPWRHKIVGPHLATKQKHLLLFLLLY